MAVKKLSIKKNKVGKLQIHKKGSTDGESAQEPAGEELQEESGEEENYDGEELVEEEASLEDEAGDTDDGVTAEVSIDGDVVGKVTHIKIKSKQAKAVIGKTGVETTKEGGTVESEHTDEEVAEVELHSSMANIGFSVARSINMGNYESLKVSVSINVPSLVDVDEIEDNYEFAKGWCEEKMNTLVEEYTDEFDEGVE